MTMVLEASDRVAVPRVGLGCMGMSAFYGERDDAASLDTLLAAYELGVRHFDTADFYGDGDNERLLGRFLSVLGGRRHQIMLATKFGIRRVPGTATGIEIDSSPEYVRRACDASLQRLGTDHIDLYYVHRRAPDCPIEDTVGALADLIKAGKIRAIGLSEVSAATLRSAVAQHPVAALQSEYSLWSRDVESGVLDACEELNVALVAYSPLGRGFLAGIDRAALGKTDLRHHLPRFQESNFESNQRLLIPLREVAESLGVSTSQVALAWVLAQRPFVHAIPGTRSPTHLRTNFDSRLITLTPAQTARLSEAFSAAAVHGTRYPEHLLRTVNV